MKVAVPVSRKRVSPVFDTARTLTIVELSGQEENGRYRLELPDESLINRVDRLTANDIEVLLCGAVSRPLLDLLEAAGIRTIPFLSGEIEIVLQAFTADRLSEARFLMPGCCGRRRRRRGGCPQQESERKDRT